MNFKGMKFALAAFLAVSMLISPSAAFGVGGAVFIEEISPGQEIIHEITVLSREYESPENMTAEVFGFTRNLDGVNVEISPEEDTGPFTARPFFTVEPKSFTLEPGELETLLLTGTVPEDVGSGGRYAMVTITTAPEAKEGGNVMVSTAIQVLVMLTIKDSDLVKTGEIEDLAAAVNDDNVSVDLIFENTGNVHYKPLVSAVLKSEDGQVLAEAMPEERTNTILPMDSRLCQFDLIPDGDLAPGTYTVEATVTLEDGTVLDTKETTLEV